MTLYDDWKQILLRAWSVRFALLAAALGTVEQVLPLFQGAIPQGTFGYLSVGVSLLVIVSRVVAQPKTLGSS